MYALLIRRLPRRLVDTLYLVWYALLMVLIVYFHGIGRTDFPYLRF